MFVFFKGLIHVDDTIVEVNGHSAKGKNPEALIKMLHGYRGALTFKLVPGESKRKDTDEVVCIHVIIVSSRIIGRSYLFHTTYESSRY